MPVDQSDIKYYNAENVPVHALEQARDKTDLERDVERVAARIAERERFLEAKVRRLKNDLAEAKKHEAAQVRELDEVWEERHKHLQQQHEGQIRDAQQQARDAESLSASLAKQNDELRRQLEEAHARALDYVEKARVARDKALAQASNLQRQLCEERVKHQQALREAAPQHSVGATVKTALAENRKLLVENANLADLAERRLEEARNLFAILPVSVKANLRKLGWDWAPPNKPWEFAEPIRQNLASRQMLVDKLAEAAQHANQMQKALELARTARETAERKVRMWEDRVHAVITGLPILPAPGTEPAWMRALGITIQGYEMGWDLSGCRWDATFRVEDLDRKAYTVRASGPAVQA